MQSPSIRAEQDTAENLSDDQKTRVSHRVLGKVGLAVTGMAVMAAVLAFWFRTTLPPPCSRTRRRCRLCYSVREKVAVQFTSGRIDGRLQTARQRFRAESISPETVQGGLWRLQRRRSN